MSIKTVVLNGKKMNYDGNLDYSILSDEVVVYDDTAADEVLECIQGFDVVVTKEMPVPADLLAQFPDCVKLLAEAGTGYNNIHLPAAREKGITVCNVAGYSTQRVAHTAIMMILNLSSCMRVQMNMLARGDHSSFTRHLPCSHTEVNGKVLGIIGAGTIGREVIKVAQALGMEILIYTVNPPDDGMNYVSLEELMSRSDYISLHCPLTPQTRHIINEETLSLMKPTACIINTARGPLVDEAALIQALQEGRIAGAGLDVQETEPPAEDNPLYTMENVILTPHMGWRGLESRQRLISLLADNIRSFFDGKPINVVS